MKWLPFLLVCLIAAATGAGPVLAGTQNMAAIGLHAQDHVIKGDQPCVWSEVNCSDWTVNWPVNQSANVYLLLALGEPGPGIAGLRCGIEYGPNVSVYEWTLCASGVGEPSTGEAVWPASGSGIHVTWDAVNDCQRTVIQPFGVHALAGSFYVYAYGADKMEVTPYPGEGSGSGLQAEDCAGTVSELYFWTGGVLGFGNVYGYPPCGIYPVETTSWGRIKARY